MKSNRFLALILSGAMTLPLAALAQDSGSATSGDTANATSQQATNNERGQRGEKFAEALNLTPEQKADLKSIHENTRQQAQAIKNDSSLTADQKKAKFKELRKSSREQMMAKLTPDQQKKFKEMRAERRGHRRHGKKGNVEEGTQS
ncbi:MAG TPA: Spy/CpxP family protein refolding chaperone [Terriglobales bacterium]|nr:Spy/CpxP family protein refolding chaperone [Terriglobales bacterium]